MSRDTRAEIIAAAKALFLEKGYRGGTTREIAEKAGIAEVTLFRHFGSKKDLFLSVVKPIFTDSLRNFIRTEEVHDVGALLRKLAADRIGVTGENSDLFRLLFYEMQFHEDIKSEFSEIVMEILDALGSAVAAGQSRGEFKKIDPKEAGFIFFSSIVGAVILRQIHGLGGEDIDNDMAVEVFLDGIRKRK
ncbi:MAG: TetR/AcrR family transcriptional regulator [Clostridia bacterium]|nr:TetR/AcrR family transcriptional regulator [Clostridia bacterium]